MITFNGIYLGDYMRINTIDRGGIIPPRSIQTLDIPQKTGAYKINQKTEAREITIGVTVIGVSYTEIRKRLETIGAVLNTDDPVPIVFDDEKDRTYYGQVSGGTLLDEKNMTGKGTITFYCPDPHKYGQIEGIIFPPDNINNFINDTNSEIFPRYRIQFNGPTTFFTLFNETEEIIIGSPALLDQTTVPREQLILNEPFSSFTGWSATNAIVNNGIVAGSFAVTNDNFTVSSFGTGPRWHGPALVKTLSEPLTDFQMELFLEIWGTGTRGTTARAQMSGRVELYLLDVNNQIIGKFAVKDAHENVDQITAEAWLGDVVGGQEILNDSYGDAWQRFDGRIYVERINNMWKVTVGQYDAVEMRHHSRLSAVLMDIHQNHAQKVAKVEVHMAQHSTRPATHMLLDHMKVWKYNQVTTTAQQVPYIVNAGDFVEIDMATGGIYKNGAPWMSEINPGSSFFPLKPGTNPLGFYSDTTAKIDMIYQKRWL